VSPIRVLEMFGATVAFVAGVLTGVTAERYEFQNRAVKAGAAEFNSQTAAFQWVTPKEPEHDYALDVKMQIERARQENWKCE
jgi:hypothetical protein